MTAPLHQLKVIQLIAVLHDILLDLASNGPSDKVLHRPGTQKCRISYRLDANADLTLLHEGDGGFQRFRHAESRHHDGQPAAGKRADTDVLGLGETQITGLDDAHVV